MRQAGFTLLEVIAVLTAVIVVIAILLVTLAASNTARPSRGQIPSDTQVRGIHQALVTYAHMSRTGGGKGYYPGLNPTGDWPDANNDGQVDTFVGSDYQASGPADKAQASTALAILLDGDYFTPEYLIAPQDPDKKALRKTGGVDTLTSANFSYAMLQYSPERKNPLTPEWTKTLHPSAVVLGDRAYDPGNPRKISSIWTNRGGGNWRGVLTHNDNSTAFVTSESVKGTKYGTYPKRDLTNIFDPSSYDGTKDAGRLFHPDPDSTP